MTASWVSKPGLHPNISVKKPVSGLAHWAFLEVLMPLQNAFHAVLLASGTKIVEGLVGVIGLFQAIHNRTGWRLPKLIALKLSFTCIRFYYLLTYHHKLLLKVNIRQLRIRNLIGKLNDNSQRLVVARELRRIAKFLELFEHPDCAPERFNSHVCSFNSLVNDVEIEVHKAHILSSKTGDDRSGNKFGSRT